MKNDDDLIKAADLAAQKAYCPYSSFRVGAALLDEEGKIWSGCNIENRSYGLSICAERNAVFKAVSAGKRKWSKLALSCPDSKEFVSPCGACRQVLSEFASPNMMIIMKDGKGNIQKSSMKELFPLDSLQELQKK